MTLVKKVNFAVNRLISYDLKGRCPGADILLVLALLVTFKANMTINS